MTINFKHVFHVSALCTFLAILEYGVITNNESVAELNAKRFNEHQYGRVITFILSIISYTVLLSVPQLICNFLGLILFNTFPGQVKIKNPSNSNSPIKPVDALQSHLCFRIVTRGLYPELVQQNVNKNYLTCIESGIINFSIEVVTDKELFLCNKDPKIRQLVVPTSYKTSTGALFKARALQYALEPGHSPIGEGDYIVHLDEETILTRDVIYGIVNFALDGKHAFGQGLITYTNLEVVNWFTTLADSYRVADDMGKLRFQFCAFHRPLFGWKGSFVVTKYEAEKDVSFDHGPDGSIAEDCYFSMVAYKKGYTFDFIQGQMWEKSPFSISDLIRQRKRWVQGIWLVVHSGKIPIKNKLLLACAHYAWVTLPITTLSYIGSMFLPFVTPLWMRIIGTFCFSVTFYMYMFGVLKSMDLKRCSVGMMFVYLIGQVFTLFLNLFMENIAVIWGLFSSKHQFRIVEKDISHKVVNEL